VVGSRVPTTVRIAALAAVLALLSNLGLLAFIHLRTHDDAFDVLRQRATEEARALDDVYRSGGRAALDEAIRETLAAGDSQIMIAIADARGRPVAGNIAGPLPPVARRQVDFAIARLRDPAKPAEPIEAGIVVRPLGGQLMLVSARSFGERLAFQQLLERSLLLAVFLSLLFGAICGLVVARYVGHRVRAIADVVDEVGEGDLARRAPIGGSGDAFDALSRRINHMLDRVGVLMGELRLLTDSLAHDLRSPVSRLRAQVERALTLPGEAQRDAALAGVLAEADGLTRILTTVLAIGRAEAMAGRRQFAWIDPGELVAELAEMYEPLAEEKGVAIAVEAIAPLFPLMAHRQLLAQALSNLLDNALNYAADGAQMTLFAQQDDEALRIGVADCGPGIAEADRAEARRRFGRLDTSRSMPGAGLGLALVDAVAHLHGGELELADNAPGLRAAIVVPRGSAR
jgi:signal transduction histidine kinase